MERKKWTKWLAAGIETAVVLALALAVAVWRGFKWGAPFQENARYLSDGFFVTGLPVTGVGLLIWVSTTGYFDMLSYGFHSLLVLFTSLKKPKDHETFYDYKTEKDARRGKTRVELLVIGGACIALSILFLALYYGL